MIMAFLHKSRIVLAAAVGIALTIAMIGGILLSMKVDPKTLSLADRTDPSRALVYVSTTEKEILLKAIERFAPLMNGIGPANADIQNADRYEFAILRSGSGTVDWTMYGRNEKEKNHVTLVSRNDPSLFLGVADRRSSLAASPLFAYTAKTDGSFIWFRPDAVAIPDSESGDIARSLLAPYKEGMLMLDIAGRGRLMLSGMAATPQGGMIDSAVQNNDASAFALSLSYPSRVLTDVGSALTKENSALSEGLRGIAQAQLEKVTGSTDIASMSTDLLSGPLTIMMKKSDTRIISVVTGTASHPKVIDAWLTKIASVMTEGSVRRQEFFGKEYTKVDVTADEASGLGDVGDYKGWAMKRLGAINDNPFTIAVSGRKFMIGNDEALVKATIEGHANVRGGLVSGAVDIGWLSSEVERLLPFLEPVRPTLEVFLGPSPGRLTWHIAPISSGILIEWTLTSASAVQNGIL